MSKEDDTEELVAGPSNVHSVLKAGWFKEIDGDIPGHYIALKTDKILFHEKSAYQDILIFENEGFGRVMALDGLINSTEKDEFAYHEMITFIPLNAHPFCF